MPQNSFGFLGKIILVGLVVGTCFYLTGNGSLATVIAQEKDAQKPSVVPKNSEAQARIRVDTTLVVLPITAKDGKGNLVPDLQESDFRIFDDGVEQKISVFTAEAFPLSLVVLIDDDLKEKVADQMSDSLLAVATGVSADDEVLLCRFDQTFHPGKGFTSDLDELLTQLKHEEEETVAASSVPVPFVTPPSTHAPGVGEPPTAAPVNAGGRATKTLDDAIYSAAELLRDRGANRRKMILVISDGANGEKFNHHTYDDVRGVLWRDNISVYSVALDNSTLKGKFARLQRYANDTGGDIYYASRTHAMERLYSQITEQARHEYTLAYSPQGKKQSSGYHTIEVRVARPGITIKTREGYYSAPSALKPDSPKN